MNRVFIVMISVVLFSGCSEKKGDQKAILSEVLKVHEKVMSADEQAVKNKMLLDSIISKDKSGIADSAKILATKLTLADSVMEKWMHDFNPDQTGKPQDQAVAYMTQQKHQIIKIDSALDLAVKESNLYLLKKKVK